VPDEIHARILSLPNTPTHQDKPVESPGLSFCRQAVKICALIFAPLFGGDRLL